MKHTTVAATIIGTLLVCIVLPIHAQPEISPILDSLGLKTKLLPFADKANPPLPPLATFPVQLVLDDDSADAVFGFDAGSARQFLWFNSFASVGPFSLEEIWVLFPNDRSIPLGGAIQIAVYIDTDDNPVNGAVLVATYDETIQAADGQTFSVYPLATPLDIGNRDVIIGVVNRYFSPASPQPTYPAAYDSAVSQNRSYFALWPGDAPVPPDLATATTISLLTGATTGNFMIRGFGRQQQISTIPTLDGAGVMVLVALLCLGAFLLLRRNQH